MDSGATLEGFSTAAAELAGGLVGVVASLGVVGIGVAAGFVGYSLVRKILKRLA